MSDVRANAGVPVLAQFGGTSTPSACAPLVVNSNTGDIYAWKTGDVIVKAGSVNAVVGPASAVSGNVCLFDGATGLLIKDGGALGTGAFASAYTLPTATSSVLGGVKPDGTTITNTSGAISVTFGTTGGTALQGAGALGTPSGGTLTNCSGLPITSVTNLGTWTTPTFSAGDFTASVGTWTVAAAALFTYTIINKMMFINWFITGTTNNTPAQLIIKIPAAATSADATFTTCLANNGAWRGASCQTTAGGTSLYCYVDGTVGGNTWNNGTVYTSGSIVFRIQ